MNQLPITVTCCICPQPADKCTEWTVNWFKRAENGINQSIKNNSDTLLINMAMMTETDHEETFICELFPYTPYPPCYGGDSNQGSITLIKRNKHYGSYNSESQSQ